MHKAAHVFFSSVPENNFWLYFVGRYICQQKSVMCHILSYLSEYSVFIYHVQDPSVKKHTADFVVSARIDDVTTAFTRGHLLLTLRMTMAPHSESF